MKSLTYLFMFLLLATFVTAGTCTPSSGYIVCYEQSYREGDATAYVKVQHGSITGIKKGDYYIGQAYVPYSFSGDKFYLYLNANNWVTCTSSGCPSYSQTLSSSGNYYLVQNPGDNFIGGFHFQVWDKDTDDIGNSAWAWAGAGYLGGNFDIKSVECYDDSDCSTGKYCDKSGSWETWNCKNAECVTDDWRCVGNNYYNCENYYWADKGKIAGKCGVECLSNIDCPSNEYVGDTFCTSTTEVSQSYREYSCINYICDSSITDKTVQSCSGETTCINGTCQISRENPVDINVYTVDALTQIIYPNHKKSWETEHIDITDLPNRLKITFLMNAVGNGQEQTKDEVIIFQK